MRWLRDLLICDSGNVMPMVAVGLPIMLAGAGLAVDVSLWKVSASNVQNAADQAALSAIVAFQVKSENPVDTKRYLAVREAYAVARFHGYSENASDRRAIVNNAPLSGKYSGNINAFEVIIRQKSRTVLSRFFGAEPPVLTGRAVAAVTGTTANACIIALDPKAQPNVAGIIGAGSGGLNASGGGEIMTSGCDIYVNSTSSKAIHVTGGGSVTGENIYIAGNYSGLVTTTEAAAPEVGAAPVADPYAARTIPEWDSCSTQTTWSGTIENPAGIQAFCGSIKVTGATFLEPGIYIIVNGGLVSSKPIVGEDVTIVLTSTNPAKYAGTFDFKAGATLTLSAPPNGPSAGIALWADKALPHAADNFRAGSTGRIEGAIYLPSHLVNYSGSATSEARCTQLVASVIAISGGASFSHDCDDMGVEGISTGTGIRKGILAE